MSLIKTPEERTFLAGIFSARVTMLKKPRDVVVREAGEEYDRSQAWISSRSVKEGSFLWFCDEFDLDPTAVRKEMEGCQ